MNAEHWIRLFNRLEAAITHHERDEGFPSDADERLWAARDRVLRDAAGDVDWAEAVADAARGPVRARDRRREVFQAAYDAGLSFRDIGRAANMVPSAIHKVIGRQAPVDGPPGKGERGA